jgi:hypothetical protein
MGVRPDAPTIETIVLVTFYEIGKDDELVKSRNSIEFVIPAKAGIRAPESRRDRRDESSLPGRCPLPGSQR